MFCEKIFKIGVLKLCGNGFLDSLLYSLSVYNCTIVQLYNSACIAGKLKSQFRRVLTHQFWKFFHRTSCIYVGNSILDVMGWFVTHDTPYWRLVTRITYQPHHPTAHYSAFVLVVYLKKVKFCFKWSIPHSEIIRIWAEPPLENDEFLEKFILTHLEMAIQSVNIVY